MTKTTKQHSKERSFDFEVKEINEDEMTFEGYGSIFGNEDAYGDVVVKGAFKKTLQERGDKLKILWQHDPRQPIGKIIEAEEDEIGLWIKAKLVKGVEEAEKAFALLKAGVVDELSIGYDTIKEKWNDGIRYLTELKLYEVSPVTFAANSLARVTDVKSLMERFNLETKEDVISNMEEQELREEKWKIESAFNEVIYDLLDNEEMADEEKLNLFEESLNQYNELMKAWFNEMIEMGIKSYKNNTFSDVKSIVSYQDLSLAEEDRQWDSTAAVNRLREYAGGPDKEDIDWSVYRQGFLYYDPEDEENFGAYKLPIGDVIDDDLKAVPRGIFAAAAALQGARGGVDIPDEEIETAKNHLSKYYEKMDRTPPWEEKSSSMELALYSIIGINSTKEGRVLSASNRQLIKEAANALQSLLEATEPDDDKSTQKQGADEDEDLEPDEEFHSELKDVVEDIEKFTEKLSKSRSE